MPSLRSWCEPGAWRPTPGAAEETPPGPTQMLGMVGKLRLLGSFIVETGKLALPSAILGCSPWWHEASSQKKRF